ncbi:MAG: SIMPL domain-containing protein [Pseudomonadota bacterium]
MTAHADDHASTQGIQVTGRGVLLVEPDMATVTLNVTAEDDAADALKARLDRVTEQVLKMVARLDIKRRDVTAAMININPRYRREGQRSVLDGVQGSRSIVVVLRDLDRYGALLDGALGLGINGVSGMSLDHSERARLEEDALGRAIDDAQRRARFVADQFDVRLGALLDAEVQAGYSEPQARMMRSEAMNFDAGGDFSPGEIRITRDVRALFAIRTR